MERGEELHWHGCAPYAPVELSIFIDGFDTRSVTIVQPAGADRRALAKRQARQSVGEAAGRVAIGGFRLKIVRGRRMKELQDRMREVR